MKEEEPDPRLERVVRFVEDEMDTAERVDFEKEMADDPSLRSDVDAARRAIEGLRTLGEERLRQELKNADAEVAGAPGASRTRWWWAAAAVLLLGGLAWWLVPTRDTPQALADEFRWSEPGLPVLMGTSPRAMDAIMYAYKQEDFGTANSLLAAALERDPRNDTLQYFRGVLQDRVNGCASAEAWYAQVHTTSVFASKAGYGLALCTLKQGDLSLAREQLRRVVAMGDPQVSPQARTLLLRLDKI